MPGSEHGHFQAQQAARNAVREASLQLQEAERRREELALQLEDVNQWFDEAAPPPAAVSHPLDSRIQSLESGLDQMLLKYTERHPDVVSTRRLIAELQAKRDEEVRASASGAAGGHSRDRMENPLYQQISIALGAAESEVAALQARVEEYKRRDTELGQRVDRALQVESEEAALNRDYEAIGRNYSTLVARLESLNIADEAAKSSESFKFNVVDPPRVPTEPSAPNRPVMNATILGVAFAAGGGLAWLLAMIRPAVYGRESVRDFTDLPLLGTIARVMSPREVREHWVRLGLFLGGSAAMLGAYGFIVLFESPVAQAVSRLRDVVVQII
jgi:polysaccharide chain length determinant protein (PEP-CTERM system associated)